MPATTTFESETCGRCGGSGRYSYNQTDGDRCYGCGGKGIRLTKRGAAAKAFYLESCMVPVAEIEVGHSVPFGGVTLGGAPFSRKLRVTRIEHGVQRWRKDNEPEWRETPTITLWAGNNGAKVAADGRIRRYWPEAENQARIEAALAYQATLTKAGQPFRQALKEAA